MYEQLVRAKSSKEPGGSCSSATATTQRRRWLRS